MNLIPAAVIKYVTEAIDQYDIDESHGIKHAQNTVNYAQNILAEMGGRTLIDGLDSELARQVIIVAAYVHDLIDQKYVPVGMMNSAKIALNKALIAGGMSYLASGFVLIIIDNISFSKRIERAAMGLKMIDLAEPLQLAAEIVCDADMLDAYDPLRCIKYNSRKYDLPDNDPVVLKQAKSVLVDRILKYKDEYFNTDAGRRIAAPLHEGLKKYVAENMAGV